MTTDPDPRPQAPRRPDAAVAVIAAAGLMTAACASDDVMSDPLFWEGVSMAADLTALVLILDSDCYTRVDGYGYSKRICRSYAPPPRHRPHPPHRPHGR